MSRILQGKAQGDRRNDSFQWKATGTKSKQPRWCGAGLCQRCLGFSLLSPGSTSVLPCGLSCLVPQCLLDVPCAKIQHFHYFLKAACPLVNVARKGLVWKLGLWGKVPGVLWIPHPQISVYSSFTVIDTASPKCWEYAGWPANVVMPLLREHLIVKRFIIFHLCFS